MVVIIFMIMDQAIITVITNYRGIGLLVMIILEMIGMTGITTKTILIVCRTWSMKVMKVMVIVVNVIMDVAVDASQLSKVP